MARSITNIQNEIITNIQANPTLAGLTSPSQTALWRLWTFIMATSMATEEQLSDQLKIDVENIAASAAPATSKWIQAQVFKFQYNSTTPQIVKLNTSTLAPFYDVVNASYRIITRCSVNQGPLNSVIIKVAKGTTPAPLITAELNALKSYLNTIKPTGIIYNVVSTDSDKLFTDATIYYNGMYAAVILSNLQTAYDNYLASIPFDGVIRLTDLEIALKNVVGVNDVVLNSVQARSNATSFGNGVYLMQNNTEFLKQYSTVAGYIVDETTSGKTFSDTVTLVAET